MGSDGVGLGVGVVAEGVGEVVAAALGGAMVGAQPASTSVAIVATIPTLPRCAMGGETSDARACCTRDRRIWNAVRRNAVTVPA